MPTMLSWIQARLRDHFGFSRAETKGTLVLLLLTSTCLLVPQGLKWYYSRQPEASHNQDMALLERTLALLRAKEQSAKPTHTKPSSHSYRLPQPTAFDINAAGKAQLSTIKGIGPVLAARIVKLRNKLGGFVSQAQYQEVYGLQPEVIKRLNKHTYICTAFCPASLNINTADVNTLAAHPYLTYQQAQAIICYRAQHGPFSTAAALRALLLLDEATWEKLKPYLATSKSN